MEQTQSGHNNSPEVDTLFHALVPFIGSLLNDAQFQFENREVDLWQRTLVQSEYGVIRVKVLVTYLDMASGVFGITKSVIEGNGLYGMLDKFGKCILSVTEGSVKLPKEMTIKLKCDLAKTVYRGKIHQSAFEVLRCAIENFVSRIKHKNRMGSTDFSNSILKLPTTICPSSQALTTDSPSFPSAPFVTLKSPISYPSSPPLTAESPQSPRMISPPVTRLPTYQAQIPVVFQPILNFNASMIHPNPLRRREQTQNFNIFDLSDLGDFHRDVGKGK